MKYDISLLTQAADAMLAKLANPRHRAIITNYRRHAILEVTGGYEEILAPDMTVAEPVYWLHQSGGSTHLKGMKAIHALYQGLVDTQATVMTLEDEKLAVADWGFSSEATFQSFMPGWTAVTRGAIIDEPSAVYIETTTKSMQWYYDDRNLMIGEHVYSSAPTFRKCLPEEVITLDEARRVLRPLIDKVPALAA